MTTETSLAKQDIILPIAERVFGGERMPLIRALLPKQFTEADLADVEAFAETCERTKLDFFAKPPQIYAIRRWDSKERREKLTAQPAVDSYRIIAVRTREYQGQVGPLFTADGQQWVEVWLREEPPAAAKVGVRRRGFPEPIWAIATWRESAQWFKDSNGKPYLGEFWRKMPAHMLGKTAEVDAFKRAFPNDTEGLEGALIEAELRERVAINAQRYTEIFGSEELGTGYDLDRKALNAAGDTIDILTGELLEEDQSSAASAAPRSDQAEPEASPSGSDLISDKRHPTGGWPDLPERRAAQVRQDEVLPGV